MPVHVEHRGSGRKPWKIIETATGRVKGSSTTRRDAEISASRRNQFHRKKHKGGKS